MNNITEYIFYILHSLKSIFTNALDTFSNAFKVIEIEHYRIHAGSGYKLSLLTPISANSYKYCQFKTGSKYIHFKEENITDGNNTIICRLYENPTIINGTTQIIPVNCNRNSLNTSDITIYSNPTGITVDANGIITSGLLLDQTYLSGTNQSATTPRESKIEFVLKPNTTYLFQGRNMGSGEAMVNAKFFWYEV